MASLTPNDLALLPAMMGTIGTMWAIGVAVYQFVFNYLKQTEDRAMDNAARRWRYRRYGLMFATHIVSGLFTAASILLSGAALAFDSASLVAWAGATFVVALLLTVSALSYEIATSIHYVMERAV